VQKLFRNSIAAAHNISWVELAAAEQRVSEAGANADFIHQVLLFFRVKHLACACLGAFSPALARVAWLLDELAAWRTTRLKHRGKRSCCSAAEAFLLR
jgi:hypothetical protein